MYDFTNKYICLVLTCNKPEYKERLDKHKYIYNKINKSGFEIVFLYANPNIKDYYINKDETGYYSLSIPTEEAYKNLSTKMLMAYMFFNMLSIKGILKIDDDIYSIDDSVLDLDYYEVDYLGIATGSLYHINSVCSKNKRKDIYKDINLAIDISKLQYDYFYGGPFYWVSNKAIKYIANSPYPYEIIGGAEDMFVGLSLGDKSDIKRYSTNWHAIGCVKFLDGLNI